MSGNIVPLAAKDHNRCCRYRPQSGFGPALPTSKSAKTNEHSGTNRVVVPLLRWRLRRTYDWSKTSWGAWKSAKRTRRDPIRLRSGRRCWRVTDLGMWRRWRVWLITINWLIISATGCLTDAHSPDWCDHLITSPVVLAGVSLQGANTCISWMKQKHDMNEWHIEDGRTTKFKKNKTNRTHAIGRDR